LGKPIIKTMKSLLHKILLISLSILSFFLLISSSCIKEEPGSDVLEVDFIVAYGYSAFIDQGQSVKFERIKPEASANEELHWLFQGGTPSESYLESPEITYNTPGTYDVTLEVWQDFYTDNEKSGSETKSGFITVYSASLDKAPSISLTNSEDFEVP